MTAKPKRKLLIAVAAMVLVAATAVAALAMTRSDTALSSDAPSEAGMRTAPIEQRDLAEYLEITGTLEYEGAFELATRNSGVLMHLAGEGTVIHQGDRLYLLLHEPSDADTARVLADVASARESVSAAGERLNDLIEGPSSAEVAAARAAVEEAIEARDRLFAEPSAAELSSAQAAVLSASEALDALDDPSAGELAAARTAVTNAEARLTELTAEPTEAEIKTAEAARLAAWRHLRDELQLDDNSIETEVARAELLTAEEALADLLAGPSTAEIDDAQAQVLAAAEALELLENPTEVQYAQARAQLDSANEALADLQAEPTSVEIDVADAAILTARQTLGDLLAEPTEAETAALEASLASAEAALVSAQSELAAQTETARPLYAMYGAVPAYRTMTVGLEGDDVLQLEENLAALGYGDSELFTPDGVFDEQTAEAVRSWQGGTDQNVDGVVGTSDVVFIAGPSQVGPWEQGIEIGQESSSGRALASLTVIETPRREGTSTTQRVLADLPLSDRDLISVGTAVNVELPDSADLAGTVAAIDSSPALDSQSGENIVEVTVLLSAPASPTWIGATVTVEVTETLISDALVVPATALLALVEGGHGVEVASEDGSTRLVGVETGLFVDGDVEIISNELNAGMRVVVPR